MILDTSFYLLLLPVHWSGVHSPDLTGVQCDQLSRNL